MAVMRTSHLHECRFHFFIGSDHCGQQTWDCDSSLNWLDAHGYSLRKSASEIKFSGGKKK